MNRFTAPLAILTLMIAPLSGCTANGSGPLATPSATVAPPAAPPPTDAETLKPKCQTDADRVRFEAAYRGNIVALALIPFYATSRSSNQAARDLALDRLKSRFSGKALDKILQRVASWPENVDIQLPPGIDLDSYTESDDCSMVTLHTTETWQILGPQQSDVYHENSVHHVIKMKQGPGIFFEKWVVTEIDP